MQAIRRIAGAWSRYWFQTDRAVSLSLLRIGIFICLTYSFFWFFFQVASGAPFWRDVANREYYPKGILQLLPGQVNSLWIRIIAPPTFLFLMMSIFGCFTRVAMPLAVIGTWIVSSTYYSFRDYWNHGWTLPLQVAIGFMLARGTTLLSIDALVARYLRGRSWKEIYDACQRAPQWPIVLTQASCALMFLAAFLHKTFLNFEQYPDSALFAWVWSDNMRVTLVGQWMHAKNPPALIGYVAARPWAWTTMAAMNLVSQFLPIFACFCMKRPGWRLFFGSFFVLEVCGLRLVMGLGFWCWLWLVICFVDWEYYLARLRKIELPSALQQPSLARGKYWEQSVIAVALGLMVLVNSRVTVSGMDISKWLSFYPFSEYRMYSLIRPPKPYGEHKDFICSRRMTANFETPEGEILEVNPHLLKPAAVVGSQLPDGRPVKVAWVRDLARLASNSYRMSPSRVRKLNLYVESYIIPAYPKPAELTKTERELLLQYDPVARTITPGPQLTWAQIPKQAWPKNMDTATVSNQSVSAAEPLRVTHGSSAERR